MRVELGNNQLTSGLLAGGLMEGHYLSPFCTDLQLGSFRPRRIKISRIVAPYQNIPAGPGFSVCLIGACLFY